MKRLLPPTLFLISIVLMLILHWLVPLIHWLPAPLNYLGILLIIVGLFASVWGSYKFTRVGTNIKTFNQPDYLVTDGLFKYSRNPMYLGFALALLGTAVVLGTISPLLIFGLFVLITDRWYIAFEEKAMQNKFGQTYKEYCRTTRRWL